MRTKGKPYLEEEGFSPDSDVAGNCEIGYAWVSMQHHNQEGECDYWAQMLPECHG